MARCPFAVWRPLPENDTQPRITPRVIIYHSAACGCSTLHHYFGRGDITLESHFYVRTDGTVEQYMDTNVRADANRHANSFAISVESEDDGTPDDTPWTDAQLASHERIARWAHAEPSHRIPLVRCTDPYGSGIGFHTMFGAPSAWTPVVKTCPGRARIQQFERVLLPRLLATPEDVMNAAQEQKLDTVMAWLEAMYKKNWQGGDLSWLAGVEGTIRAARDSIVARLDSESDEIKADIRSALADQGVDGATADEVADAVLAKIKARL